MTVHRALCLAIAAYVAAISGVSLVAIALVNDQIPAQAQSGPIAIINVTIHPAVGKTIERGTVVFDKGRIVAVGSDVIAPEGARTIDAAGRHLYPGMIESATALGLVEIDAVRATNDREEPGPSNPNVRVQVAFNPDSELIPVARTNGVLLAHVVPGGDLFCGTSAVMRLDGWTWEEMTQLAPAGLILQWPRMVFASGQMDEEAYKKQIESRDRQLRLIENTIASARDYQRLVLAGGRVDFDARLSSMSGLVAGDVPLHVVADEAAAIEAACDLAKREKFKLVIIGGRDAADCVEAIKSVGASVIITGTHRLPNSPDRPYDDAFTLPKRLQDAGIRFAISGAGPRGWASNVRNLPYHAGTAASFGLDKEDAVRAITLWPAQILGIDQDFGSIEVGKSATLFIADGDILEMPSNVKSAFINGREIDLSNKQTSLAAKYRERLRQNAAPHNAKLPESPPVVVPGEPK